MDERSNPQATRARHVAFGAVLIVIGLLAVLNGRDIGYAFTMWPLILVGFGLARVVAGCCARDRRSGAWLLVFGGWFALNRFTVLGYHDTWPLLVVAIGAMIAWDAIAPAGPCPNCAEVRHAR
jgi:hypothetical protein